MSQVFKFCVLMTALVALQRCESTVSVDAHSSGAISCNSKRSSELCESASGLGWVESSPRNAFAATAQWTKSTAPDLTSQKIQFYNDAKCQSPFGGEITFSKSDTKSYSVTVNQYGTILTYKIQSTTASGKSNWSSCSPEMAFEEPIPAPENTSNTQMSKTYSSYLLDTTDWVSDMSGVNLGDDYYGGAGSYRRNLSYRDALDDEVMYKYGAYVYHWHRDETTFRGFALYKSNATLNNDQIGISLIQLCSSWQNSPQLLGSSNTRVFFSADYNCNGLADIVILNLADDTVTGLVIDQITIDPVLVFNDRLIYSVSQGGTNAIMVTDGTLVGTSSFISGNVYPQTAAATSTYAVVIYSDAAAIKFAKWTGSGAPALSTLTGVNTGWGARSAVAAGSYILFAAKSTTEGFEVFKTDGTNAGTSIHKIFNPGAGDGSRTILPLSGNRALLSGDTGSGYKVSISDGTTVTNFTSSLGNRYPQLIIGELGGKILFQLYSVSTPGFAMFDTALDTFTNLTSYYSGFALMDYQNIHCKASDRYFFPDFQAGLYQALLDGSTSHIAASALATTSSIAYFKSTPSSRLGLNCFQTNMYGDGVVRILSDYSVKTYRRGSSLATQNSPNSTANYLLSKYSPGGNDLNSALLNLPSYKISDNGAVAEVVPSDSTGLTGQLGSLKFFTDVNDLLYAFDTTTGATTLVKDLKQFAGYSYGNMVTNQGPYAYIFSNVGLLRTDGTTAGTILVSNQITGGGNGKIAYWNSMTYFVGSKAPYVPGIFQTTGAAGNLTQIASTNTDLGDVIRYGNTGVIGCPVNSTCVFYNGTTTTTFISDTLYGSTIWPMAGTGLLRGSEFFYTLQVNSSYTVRHRRSTDGVSESFNALVAPFNLDFNIYESVQIGSDIYVPAVHTTQGIGLWKFNSTFTTATEIKNFRVNGTDAKIQHFVLRGNKMFFASDAAGDGLELWVSDGTSAGTKLVKELVVNGGSNPVPLNITTDNRIWVSADIAHERRGILLLEIP